MTFEIFDSQRVTPFENVSASDTPEPKRLKYTRDRGSDGKFIGSMLNPNDGVRAEVFEVEKNFAMPKLPKMPKPPKMGAGPKMPTMPKVAMPQTASLKPVKPRIRETGIGKSWRPATKGERLRERGRNAAGSATSAGLLSGGITAALNAKAGRATALRSGAQMVGIGGAIGGVLGGAAKPRGYRYDVRKERGELVARQFRPEDHQRRSRRISKMGPDQSEVSVPGGTLRPVRRKRRR